MTVLEPAPAGGSAVPTCPAPLKAYIKRLDASVMDLFHHAIAVLHDSTYNQLNADALRAEGPRLPLPGWPDGAAEGRHKHSLNQRRAVVNSPPCSIPKRPSPVSRKPPCARKSPPSLSPPLSRAAT